MSTDPLTAVSTRSTPQTQRADDRQDRNAAGGYTFAVDDMALLHRFLTLGTTGGTFYTSEADLTRDTAGKVLDLARHRGTEVVTEVLDISRAGRAPRHNPALFALAAVAGLGDPDARSAALGSLPMVARTGTHLFTFATYVEQFRGWGRGLRRAVGGWYTDLSLDDLGYQVAKYRQRGGWTHRDLLRLAHPATDDPGRKALLDWVCGHELDSDSHATLPDPVRAYAAAQDATTPAGWVDAVTTYGRSLSWEMLPTEALAEPTVWEALVDAGVPMTALIRNLPRLTRLGVIQPMGGGKTRQIVDQITDSDRLRTARVHPINLLIAHRTYASGQSARGGSTWTPVAEVVDALDTAFYRAYGAVEPTGKRTMLALDVSGSMGMSTIGDLPITPREASAALALVTATVEPYCMVVGFSDGQPLHGGPQYRARWPRALTPLAISPKQRLDDATRAVSDLSFGGTDCALPMLAAIDRELKVDTFVVVTDNETWYGDIHPHQALTQYREQSGIDARLVVVAMTGTRRTIADPTDPGTLDVSGFDAAVPNLIAQFSARAI